MRKDADSASSGVSQIQRFATIKMRTLADKKAEIAKKK